MSTSLPLSQIIQTAGRAKGCETSEGLYEQLHAAGYDFTLAAVHSWWLGRYAPRREAAAGLADFFGFDGEARIRLYEARPDYIEKRAGPPRRRKRAAHAA